MTNGALGTAKEFVDEVEAVHFIRRFGLDPTLAQNAREIFNSEKWVSGGILAGSKGEKFFDERWMRQRLVGLQRCVES